jgi:hypothetical protein
MTVPTDFRSFCSGFNLTLANYPAGSGVGGGTFTNMVAGMENWTRGSVGPTFSNIGGSSQIEAATFDNTVNSQIVGRWPFGQECTVIITAQAASFAALKCLFGHTNANNQWIWYVDTGSKATNLYTGFGESAASANSATGGVAFVAAFGFSPVTKKAWVQLNKGSPVSDTTTSVNVRYMTSGTVAIGRSHNLYMNGSIGRVLIFSECLFERNTSGTHTLQTLMTTECANIGI